MKPIARGSQSAVVRGATRRRGVSLVELILSIVILGLAIPPLVIQLSTSTRQQTNASLQQNLLRLTSERAGEILSDQSNPTRGYDYIVESAYPDEKAPGGFTGYTRKTLVREVSTDDFVTEEADSGLKRIRIEVGGPGDQSLAIETFVADPDLLVQPEVDEEVKDAKKGDTKVEKKDKKKDKKAKKAKKDKKKKGK